MHCYLQPNKFINWTHHNVLSQARQLGANTKSQRQIVNNCYEFVRDSIQHTVDAGGGPLTLRASEVLAKRTGFCYAKSHLLAALLRANGIATALCYQRLNVGASQFCLHGLNAVYLREFGWLRLDARGGRQGGTVSFSPPLDALVFQINEPGEQDSNRRFAEPLECVVAAYQAARSSTQLQMSLPDCGL